MKRLDPIAPSARRAFLLAGVLAPWLAACGGGGGAGTPAPPARRGSFVPAAPFMASQHTANLAPDGTVIVIGGSRGESVLSAGIDRFNPATAAFSRIGELEIGRAGHRAVDLGGGDILVIGGLRSTGDPRLAELVRAGTGQASAAGTMSVSRVDHAAVRLADGRVLVAGGSTTGERAPLGISDSAEIWDPATRSFRRLAQRMTIARAAHTATLLSSGKVLIAGGYSWSTPYVFAEVFDPASETFTPVPGNWPVRASHVAHRAPDGQVLLIGGETVAADGQTIVPLASTLSYSPASNTLQARASLASPRTWAASVMLPSGEVLLFGGQRELPGYVGTAEALVADRGGTELTPLDADRALHTATLLADGRILIVGGEGTGGPYRRTTLLYTA